MAAYYNEHDPFAAAWLRNLIAVNMIAPGDVDERSIEDVVPLELHKYAQCHFFAGIGVWSYSMRRAGWADNRRGWSGSCPCQPFSQAGQGEGFADERHLWPAFFHLIEQCGPDVVLGEQVASKDGLAWLDLVQSDMEAANYAFGALDTCAAGYGAPHIRQRLYWMGHARSARLPEQRRIPGTPRQESTAPTWQTPVGTDTPASGVPDPAGGGSRPGFCDSGQAEQRRPFVTDGMFTGGLANPFDGQLQEEGRGPFGRTWQPGASQELARPGPTNGAWDAVDWLRCRDDRWRPVEPDTFPLVNGSPNRVGLLRGYGNAIVAPQAEEWARLALEYAP